MWKAILGFFENKYDLATPEPWWKDDLGAERRNAAFCSSRAEAVLQTEANKFFFFVFFTSAVISCSWWHDQRGRPSTINVLIIVCMPLFRGTDKMEQLLHTFVFVETERERENCLQYKWKTILSGRNSLTSVTSGFSPKGLYFWLLF